MRLSQPANFYTSESNQAGGNRPNRSKHAALWQTDDLGEFSANVFTASSAGDYQVCASLFTGSLTLIFELSVFKNGVRERGFVFGTGIATGCRVIRLLAGDTLDARAYQASGATVTINANYFWNWVTLSKL